MRAAVVLLCCLVLTVAVFADYSAPVPSSGFHFLDPFNDGGKWHIQLSDPEDSTRSLGKIDFRAVTSARSSIVGIADDQAMVLVQPAKHYLAYAHFDTPFDSSRGLVLQYELRFLNKLECGGAYLKLVRHESAFQPSGFSHRTPYVIMFGPDHCGETDRVHFIFQHQNPISKKWEEKHLVNPPHVKYDTITHYYTLHVRPDNSFDILIDGENVRSGNLLEDFSPAVNPPKTIDDPNVPKPADWVEEEFIPDPHATKPADWDEDAPKFVPDETAVKPADWDENAPEHVADPSQRKPDDWDDELDGQWEADSVPNPECVKHGCGPWSAPLVPNPEYKGKWEAPEIKNPAYKGVWVPPQIPNPNYFSDNSPSHFALISGVGLEVWTMTSELHFDNIWLGADITAARDYAKLTSHQKMETERTLAQDQGEPLDDDDEQSMWERVVEQLEDLATQLQESGYLGVVAFGGTAVAVLVPTLLCCVVVIARRSPSPAPAAKSTPPPPASLTATGSDAASPAAASSAAAATTATTPTTSSGSDSAPSSPAGAGLSKRKKPNKQ